MAGKESNRLQLEDLVQIPSRSFRRSYSAQKTKPKAKSLMLVRLTRIVWICSLLEEGTHLIKRQLRAEVGE